MAALHVHLSRDSFDSVLSEAFHNGYHLFNDVALEVVRIEVLLEFGIRKLHTRVKSHRSEMRKHTLIAFDQNDNNAVGS